ncbi:unnamed protein product [Pieris macdunnoughi]|uniref:Uncharacterized protein n=1 Tax=Pieris macdunnoughi TaxID=345717 RepID=A0A821WKM4_9NEOP|nr:unnamed protein product [Pieris macdunnoughi]
MYDNYMDNFLKKVNKSYVTRNTDSTDFEYPTKIPAVSIKHGKHHLLDGVSGNDSPPNIQMIYEDPKLKSSKERDKKYFKHVLQKYCSKDKLIDTQIGKEESYQKNRGDHQGSLNTYSKSLQGKVLPRLSHIFRRPSNYTKQLPSIEENHKIDTNQYLYCVGCEQRRIKKRRKARGLEQPVYNVEGDLLTPFLTKISAPEKHASKNQSSGTPSPLTSSVGSIDNRYKQRSIMTAPDDGIENYEIFYNQTNLDGSDYKRHKTLQYPSMYSKRVTQAMRNTCCQINYGSLPGKSNDGKVKPSSSSSFWNFVAEKIQAKYKKKDQFPNDCACEQIRKPPQITNQKQDMSHCCPTSCEKFKNILKGSSDTLQSPNRGRMSPDSIQMQGSGSSGIKLTKAPDPHSLSKNATSRDCQCNSKELKTYEPPTPTYNECQKPHDEITAALAESYNGEILCIHNPPCVLINGCLNLPPPKPSGLMNIWRFTQHKKSSEFRKNKYQSQFIEQACQYEQPFVIQDLLPEFQTEKIVQSVCNHKPPCEIVRGCYKPKLDQTLKDSRSCVHVPMCPKLPECLLRHSADGQAQCPHRPRCREFPMCSKKLLLLTAKEDMSTQVRPRSRMVCRHDPPCLMIPRCIARVLCTDSVPYDAIPDCVHQPFCELIPACCRKTAKEMPSLTSNDEGVSIKVPRMPLHQRNRLMRLINSKR